MYVIYRIHYCVKKIASANAKVFTSKSPSHSSYLPLLKPSPTTHPRSIPLPQRLRFSCSFRRSRSLIPSSAPFQSRSISRVK